MPYADKDAQRLFQKTRKRRAKEWFWNLKDTLACAKCGASHPAIIQFHHKNGSEKEAGISRMVNQVLPREAIMAEISKCEVLCANCHAILHYEKDHKDKRLF